MPKEETRPRHSTERKPYDTPAASTPSAASSLSAESASAASMSKAPPVVHKALDDHRIEQRRKQIDFGKNTRGYDRYLQLVPKDKRTRTDPKTPDIHSPIGKRQFDGQVRAWRRQLHKYDESGDGEEDVFDFAATHQDDSQEEAPEPERPDLPQNGLLPSADRSDYVVDIFGEDSNNVTDGLLDAGEHIQNVTHPNPMAHSNSKAPAPVVYFQPPQATRSEKPTVTFTVSDENSQPPMDCAEQKPVHKSVVHKPIKSLSAWIDTIPPKSNVSWADLLSDEEISQPSMAVA